MNKIIFLSFILLLIASCVKAQVIFQTDYQTQADYLIYSAKDKWDTDILVYWSESKLRATKDYQDGIWYKTKYKSQADITIDSTSYKSKARVSIYVINDKFRAGAKSKNGRKWLNEIKSNQ
jgi:hypothetical protein